MQTCTATLSARTTVTNVTANSALFILNIDVDLIFLDLRYLPEHLIKLGLANFINNSMTSWTVVILLLRGRPSQHKSILEPIRRFRRLHVHDIVFIELGHL
jgi:hypothetical protein